LVNVFIYLDAATVENGCTHIVPGSQLLPYAGPQCANGGGNWADEHDAYRWIIGQELPIPMARGGVLLLNGLAFHSVGINRTSGLRRSMVFACHSVDDLKETSDGSTELLVGVRYFKGNRALPISGSLAISPPIGESLNS
jgi:ectoine hydroxylase-related dioxygenase (phytanoyl-CoA dioxygenase family)